MDIIVGFLIGAAVGLVCALVITAIEEELESHKKKNPPK